MTLLRRLDELESLPLLRAAEATQEAEAALLALLDTLDRTVCAACQERALRRMLAALRAAKHAPAGRHHDRAVDSGHRGQRAPG